MLNKLHLFFGGLFLFFVFIFFSYLVHKDVFTQIDFNATVVLQDHITRRLDGIFSFLSEVGKFEITTVVLLVILVLGRKIWAGVAGIGLFVGFHLIELYGKFFVDHMPPPQFMLRTQHLVDFPQFHIRSENSYPSGHSGRALFLSVILLVLILQNKKLSPLWKTVLCGAVIGYDIAMLVSRVYLGEHWLTDVIGGSILGASLGLLTGTFLVVKDKTGLSFPKLSFPKYKIEIKKVN